MTALMSCRDLVKTYKQSTGQVRALKGIDCDFERGRLTAVVGPSGSGKSSLLRLIAGLDRPDSGEILVADRRIDAASKRDLRLVRKQVLGYVFQRPADNLLPYLSVDEHMDAAQTAGRGTRFSAAELIARLDLAHRRHAFPPQLSGGEQQRLAFAQVLVGGAEIVVADEPTAELDSVSASAVLEVVRGLVDDGVTFVIATHDETVIDSADHAIELDRGSLKVDAPDPRNSFVARSRGHAVESRSDRAVVSVNDVSKTFTRGDEPVHALSNVTARFSSGEVAGLVGRSGSGKTTLLNLLAGWERPDAGSVDWIDDIGGALARWKDVAVVPQRFGLIEELSVLQNVEYPARLDGSLADNIERVDDILEELGLADLQDRQPHQISVGEQQRTALARALVLSPRVLLADEPSGHQDRRWAEAVFDSIGKAAARGTCCVVATHNEDMIACMSRVLEMSDGRIVHGGVSR